MPVETTLYTTLVGSDVPIEELPSEIISYSFKHNAPGSIAFRLSVDHPKCRSDVVAPNKHEVTVVRNRTIVWRGPILTADEDKEFVTFGGEGLLAHLRRWHVTTTVGTQAATDQFTFAKALIDHHQNKTGGDYGLDTSNITTSGVTRDGLIYEGFRRKNIWEAFTQLSERLNGFDFHVEPASREVVFHYPKRGRRRPEIVFDVRNIRKFGRSVDGTDQASQVLGVGAGEGEDTLLKSRQSATAVAAYKLSNTTFVDQDISVAATLQDRVDDELAYRKDPDQIIAFTTGGEDPNPLTVVEGDEVKVVWDSPYEPISEFRKVLGRKFTWSEGEEQVVWETVRV